MSRQLPLGRSLRLRLPILMSGLMALVLVAVFSAVNREIEKMLLRAGSERARAAAGTGLGLALSRGLAEAGCVARREQRGRSPAEELHLHHFRVLRAGDQRLRRGRSTAGRSHGNLQGRSARNRDDA